MLIQSNNLEEIKNKDITMLLRLRITQSIAVIILMTSISEDEMYGGIQQEYTVKGCKVTVYNDGPVKMVDEKTDEPCNAPLPKDHQFSK